MNDLEMIQKCFTCGSEFQFGIGVYDGQHIPKYNITVCSICYSGNWDGWTAHYEEKILKYLIENNIPAPNKNEAGYLPRDG